MTSNLVRRSGLPLIAACLALATRPAAAQEELRIGIIAPVTGIFAQVGADMTNGFKMYLDETKSNFAGAKVVPIIEDSQAKPDTAVTKAKKLILRTTCSFWSAACWRRRAMRWRRCRLPRRPSISPRCPRPTI
jgi:branched-chain amino acid transport system substrate-binding protein